jgi:transcriptional regulator with XRE-family HTH domain
MRMKRLREASGLSQPQAARAAGVPVGTLRGWEQGRRVPTLEAATRLAQAIGVSLDELAGADGDAPAKPAKPEFDVEKVVSLCDEIQREARKSMAAMSTSFILERVARIKEAVTGESLEAAAARRRADRLSRKK